LAEQEDLRLNRAGFGQTVQQDRKADRSPLAIFFRQAFGSLDYFYLLRPLVEADRWSYLRIRNLRRKSISLSPGDRLE